MGVQVGYVCFLQGTESILHFDVTCLDLNAFSVLGIWMSRG